MSENEERGKALYETALTEAYKDDADLPAIVALLREAIDLGNGDATYALATWYLYGKEPVIAIDFARGVELLKVAASKDVAFACFDLALCYERGEGVKKNRRRAFKNYLRGALNGDSECVYEVGRCYYFGIGIAKDKPIGRLYYRKASQLGIDLHTGLPSEEK
jgi:TPR repeat protein